jgi:hypothetical protein
MQVASLDRPPIQWLKSVDLPANLQESQQNILQINNVIYKVSQANNNHVLILHSTIQYQTINLTMHFHALSRDSLTKICYAVIGTVGRLKNLYSTSILLKIFLKISTNSSTRRSVHQLVMHFNQQQSQCIN